MGTGTFALYVYGYTLVLSYRRTRSQGEGKQFSLRLCVPASLHRILLLGGRGADVGE